MVKNNIYSKNYILNNNIWDKYKNDPKKYYENVIKKKIDIINIEYIISWQRNFIRKYKNNNNFIIWKKSKPLDISNYSFYNELLKIEKIQSSILRISPEKYLVLKYTIIIYSHNKKYKFTKTDAQKVCKGVDVNKTSILYQWFKNNKWLGISAYYNIK